MKLRRKPFLSILSLLLFTFLPLTIRAEEGGSANPQGSRMIRIDGTEIIPRSVEIKKGRSLMWVNSSPVFARVVFDTDLGQKVACVHGKQETSQARQFLLPFGSSTTCTLEPGTYTYTVYRQVAYRPGGAEVKRSRGAIVVRQ